MSGVFLVHQIGNGLGFAPLVFLHTLGFPIFIRGVDYIFIHIGCAVLPNNEFHIECTP